MIYFPITLDRLDVEPGSAPNQNSFAIAKRTCAICAELERAHTILWGNGSGGAVFARALVVLQPHGPRMVDRLSAAPTGVIIRYHVSVPSVMGIRHLLPVGFIARCEA